jgi:micrococcal nuclease
VASVYDGDTLTLTNGQRIRLLQIDTPELGSGECYSRAARTVLLNLAPVGSRLVLETDAKLDRVDRYGRLLRYLHRGSINVNLQLVKRGAAAPYFYGGERGKYANRFMTAAQAAKVGKRGLWGASPNTRLDPYRAVETGKCGPAPEPPTPSPPPPTPSPPPPTPTPPPSNCDTHYAGACVPPYPPDLNCADLRALGLSLPVQVVVIGQDPHELDRDEDGLGCE